MYTIIIMDHDCVYILYIYIRYTVKKLYSPDNIRFALRYTLRRLIGQYHILSL